MQSHNEIEIKEIIDYIFLKRKIIFICSISGFFLGVLIALTTPQKFELTISFLNEQRESTGYGGQGIAGLAGLAGVSLLNSSQAINPAVYENILESAPFIEKVRKFKFQTINNQDLYLQTYLEEYNKTSLISKMLSVPSYIRSLFKAKQTESTMEKESVPMRENWIFVDEGFRSISEHLKSSLTINNAGNGIIQISANHQDPFIAGELAEQAYDFLTEYIAEYELAKEKRKLEFTEEQLKTVGARFHESQTKLAMFKDRNANIISAQARAEEERLEADYRVAFNVYNAVMVQKEEALLKIEDNIPAFTLIETIKIPQDPSYPNKKLIVVIVVFVSLFCSIFYLLILFFRNRLLKK